jgi:hypothetical protein
MPYKARLQQGEARKRKKPGYRVTNAGAYNQSLRKRGMISLYVPDGDLKAQFINAKVRTPGVSGREPTYTSAYIELINRLVASFDVGFCRERSDKREAQIDVRHDTLKMRRYVSVCEDEGINRSSTIATLS